MLTPAQEEGPTRQAGFSVDETPTQLRGREYFVGRRIQSNMLWAGAGRCLSIAFLLLLNMCLAHQLSADDYGRYVLFESVVMVLALLILAGLPNISLRMLRAHFISGNGTTAAEIVRSTLAIMVGTSVLTTLGATAVTVAAGDHAMSGVLWEWLPWILAWAILTAYLRMVSELARGHEMLGFSYLIGGQSGGFGVNGLLLVAVLAVGAMGGESLRSILFIQTGIQFLCLVPALSVIFRAAAGSSLPDSAGTRGPAATGILRSSLPLLIQQLVAFGLPEVDTLMLGAYSSAEEIALYGSARKLVFLAVVPLLLVSHAIKPFIADFYARRDVSQLATLVRGTTTFAAIPSAVVVVILLVFPELILRTCFGDEYASAAAALRVLCIGAAAFALTGTCSLVLTMTGHERTGMWSSLAAGIVYLISAPFLIAGFGIYGAAIGAAGLQILTNVGAMLLVYYHEHLWTGFTLSGAILIECFRMIVPKKKSGTHS